MDLLSLARLVIRHWRVTVPAAVLTVIGVLGAAQLSPPTYEATGSIVLLSPPEPPRSDVVGSGPAPEVGQNPFARYGDLSVVADIAVRVIGGDSKRAEFASQGVTDYDVVANRFQRGPVVDVTGKGSSAEAAIGSTETVLEDVNATLTELQEAEHADPDYFITAAPLEPPSTATAMYGSTVRTAIAVLAVGGLGTLALAVLAEALSRRRAVRSTAEAGPMTPDTVNPGSQGGAPNGSPRVDWSGILSGLRLAREEPSKQDSASQTTPPRKQSKGEQSKQEPAWKKAARTFQPEPPSESPADNGRRRPTTDRSP
jgi:hypothetical protein